jgi:carboxyl-terminal processing protease
VRKISILAATLISLCFVYSIRAETKAAFFGSSKKQESVDESMLKEVISMVKRNYIEQLDDSELYKAAMEGVMSSLDPHSEFLDQASFQQVKKGMSGEINGIGAEVVLEARGLRVISAYDNAPAQRAGIKSGDIITDIDGEEVADLNASQAVEHLGGALGSTVKLSVFRPSTNEKLNFEIKRERIVFPSVKSKKIAGDIGYIKISFFNEKTKDQVKQAIGALVKDRAIKSYIVDLRNNPGGLMEEAIATADLFLDKGNIIMVKSRGGKLDKTYSATPGDMTNGRNIIVLINGGSASASEIAAAALQDNKRAILVGEKSFGKGSIQSVIPISNGAAIKLTTMLYYTPSGKSIQAAGIEPDITVPEAAVFSPIKHKEIKKEASLKGHIKAESDDIGSKVIHEEKGLDKRISLEEDFQLMRACDLLKALAITKGDKR